MSRRDVLAIVATVAVVAVLSLAVGSVLGFASAEWPVVVECTVRP